MVPTDEELEQRKRRTAWWLYVARKAGGMKLAAVAKVLKLKAASSVGDFERAVTEPSSKQLAIMAGLYRVKVTLLSDPPETDEERLEKIGRLADETERQGWAEEQRRGRGAVVSLDGARGKERRKAPPRSPR